MFADLHCHTNHSDHSDSTETVIRAAANVGITHLAITNHDTTAGLVEAEMIGKKHGVTIIPGIEISAEDRKRGGKAHLLGLFVTPGHPSIHACCDATLRARHEASHHAVQRLIQDGLPITWELVQTYAKHSTAVYKQHIMHALMDLGIADQIHGQTYRHYFSGPNAIAHFPIRYVDIFDAIRAVREAGGIPVIAHPGQLNNWESIPDWVEAGLEGIEVYHPDHSENDVQRAISIANLHRLAITGGSDDHGRYGRSEFPIGCRGIHESDWKNLLARKK
jgi:predicted metal-dependent phosphoesterase TrpH